MNETIISIRYFKNIVRICCSSNGNWIANVKYVSLQIHDKHRALSSVTNTTGTDLGWTNFSRWLYLKVLEISMLPFVRYWSWGTFPSLVTSHGQHNDTGRRHRDSPLLKGFQCVKSRQTYWQTYLPITQPQKPWRTKPCSIYMYIYI